VISSEPSTAPLKGAALRRLGNRLVGILHGCRKTHTLYDETTDWVPLAHSHRFAIEIAGMSVRTEAPDAESSNRTCRRVGARPTRAFLHESTTAPTRAYLMSQRERLTRE